MTRIAHLTGVAALAILLSSAGMALAPPLPPPRPAPPPVRPPAPRPPAPRPPGVHP